MTWTIWSQTWSTGVRRRRPGDFHNEDGSICVCKPHHEFRIDTGRTKFEQNTDSILHACESCQQRTQRSVWDRPESTTSCMVQAENVEETSKHFVLGRYQTCSKERIKVLSNTIERNHPLRPIQDWSKTTKTCLCQFIHQDYSYWWKIWTDVEPGKCSLSDNSEWKKLINLRHGSLPREDDGAIEFWRIKDIHQKRKQEMISVLYWCFRKNLLFLKIFLVIQDAILLILHGRTMSWFRTVSSNTFITLDVQPIYVPSSIQDWYREVKIWANDRQYFSACWSYGQRAQGSVWHRLRSTTYKQKTWKKHQNTLYWVDIKLAERRIKVLSDTIERHHFSRNTPSLLCPESYSYRNWRSHMREGICVTSTSSKDVVETWLDEGIGPEVARQALGSQPTQPNTNPNHDITGRTVVIGQPTGSSTPFNEVDIDFRESGLPHAVVKQAENYRRIDNCTIESNWRAIDDDATTILTELAFTAPARFFWTNLVLGNHMKNRWPTSTIPISFWHSSLQPVHPRPKLA